jgi:hypothetical protein
MEISFEAWEGVQRHGQDIADRLAQGFTGLLQAPPQFPWPPVSHKRMPFDIDLPVHPFGAAARGKDFFPTAAVASVIDIGGRLGQAGVEIGTSVGGAVQHAVRQLPVPFRSAAQIRGRKLRPPPSAPVGEGVALDRAVDRCPLEAAAAAAAAATGSAAASTVSGAAGGDDLDEDDEGYGCEIGTLGNFKKSKVRSSSVDLRVLSQFFGTTLIQGHSRRKYISVVVLVKVFCFLRIVASFTCAFN